MEDLRRDDFGSGCTRGAEGQSCFPAWNRDGATVQTIFQPSWITLRG